MNLVLKYFVQRHFLANFLFLLVVGAGLFSAFDIRKEELPDNESSWVRVYAYYPGAAPAEVEQAVTVPMEHELAGLESIYRMESSSRRGVSTIDIELRRGSGDSRVIVSEIQNRIQTVPLPDEIEEPPRIFHWKNSRKAIIDIALYYEGRSFLTDAERRALQNETRLLENRLLRRPQINSLTRKSYYAEEIHVRPRPEDMIKNRIGLREIRRSLIAAHTDLPPGSMETIEREQVRLDGRLVRPELFADVPLRAAFDGPPLRVNDLAAVEYAFADSRNFIRTNGHESVVLNVVKNSGTGILEGIDIVNEELAAFMKSRGDTRLRAVLLDDESYDVRNRLKIISSNALLGFALVIVILSIFLNPRTAFWVCLGIPFSLLFCLTLAYLLGYSINNMTLAAVIIAMGMLVDDAIVVSENITRLLEQGRTLIEAALEGTRGVLGPIVSSIMTTIAAFLPLFAHEGQRGIVVAVLPPVVILVLIGSLIESIFILPGHMTVDPFAAPRRLYARLRGLVGLRTNSGSAPALNAITEGEPTGETAIPVEKRMSVWFSEVEESYIEILDRLLAMRSRVLAGFAVFVLIAGGLFTFVMDFALFPGGQLQNFFVVAEAPPATDLHETARRAIPIENAVMPYVGKGVIGVRSQVGYRRYRPANEDNVVSVRVELDEEVLSPAESQDLVDRTREAVKATPGFDKIRISQRRGFSDSEASSLEILVQEDNDDRRNRVAEELLAYLQKLPQIDYAEIERPSSDSEYVLLPDRSLISQLNVDMAEVEASLRAALAGIRLFSFFEDNERKHVRLRFDRSVREDVDQLLEVPATNQEGYQVPLRKVLQAERRHALTELRRVDRRRVLKVSADIKADADATVLAMADRLESDFFPGLLSRWPTTSLVFDGEVRDTREASSFFLWAVAGVLVLVYLILSIQFDSMTRPLIVMMAIIPAWASVVYVYLLHGETVFGLFTVVGALGLSGIVVNGSILLLDRLDPAKVAGATVEEIRRNIARAASTRLRAVFLTTVTTVVGILPTAYGILGYDAMLADMMLTLAWGLTFSTTVTLVLVPTIAAWNLERKIERAPSA